MFIFLPLSLTPDSVQMTCHLQAKITTYSNFCACFTNKIPVINVKMFLFDSLEALHVFIRRTMCIVYKRNNTSIMFFAYLILRCSKRFSFHEKSKWLCSHSNCIFSILNCFLLNYYLVLEKDKCHTFIAFGSLCMGSMKKHEIYRWLVWVLITMKHF